MDLSIIDIIIIFAVLAALLVALKYVGKNLKSGSCGGATCSSCGLKDGCSSPSDLQEDERVKE